MRKLGIVEEEVADEEEMYRDDEDEGLMRERGWFSNTSYGLALLMKAARNSLAAIIITWENRNGG